MENSNLPNLDADADAELDRQTTARLSKLRTLPVDTTRLDRAILAQIPQPEHQARRQGRIPWIWTRSVRAVAASITIVALIGAILLSSSGGPVLASAVQMAQVHEDLVAGRMQADRVDSIEDANKALAAQWPEAPGLPTIPSDKNPTVPATHVMACCMQSVKNKKMACVLLRNEGVPVTMTVANASDMQLPNSPTVTRNGITYHVQSVGKLNMVMMEQNNRWLCLIGEPSADQLMDLGSRLRF